MIIFGEILFLENALTGGILLILTGKLCGVSCSRGRLVVGSILCGMYSFTLFQGEIPILLSIMEILLFSMLLIRICFGVQRLVLSVLVFFSVSFLMGGMTMGLANMMSTPAVAANGSFYLEQMTFLHIASGVGATSIAVWLMLELLHDRRMRNKTICDVRIVYKGKNYFVSGFMDTGNQLYDTGSGTPVCLVSGDLWRQLSDSGREIHQICYYDATGREDQLSVLRSAEIRIGTGKRERRYAAVLGIAAHQEEHWRWDGCQILLHGCFEGDYDVDSENTEQNQKAVIWDQRKFRLLHWGKRGPSATVISGGGTNPSGTNEG